MTIIKPLVRVALDAPTVRRTSGIATDVRVISEREFEEGPRAILGRQEIFPVRTVGDFDWPWTVYPWVAALPPASALVAAETAIEMLLAPFTLQPDFPELEAVRRIEQLAGGAVGQARLAFRNAQVLDEADRRDFAFTGIPLAEVALRFYGQVANVVAQAARALVPPGLVQERRFPARSDQEARFMRARSDFYQRWWRLVMRRLAFAGVGRASITVRRTEEGVVVRPAILGRLAGGHDEDRALLASCFGRAP